MEGLIGLLVLAILAVPVLLIVALVSVSGLKRRVADLEAEVAQLHRRAAEPAVQAAADPTLGDWMQPGACGPRASRRECVRDRSSTSLKSSGPS